MHVIFVCRRDSPPDGLTGWTVSYARLGDGLCWRPQFRGMQQYHIMAKFNAQCNISEIARKINWPWSSQSCLIWSVAWPAMGRMTTNNHVTIKWLLPPKPDLWAVQDIIKLPYYAITTCIYKLFYTHPGWPLQRAFIMVVMSAKLYIIRFQGSKMTQ